MAAGARIQCVLRRAQSRCSTEHAQLQEKKTSLLSSSAIEPDQARRYHVAAVVSRHIVTAKTCRQTTGSCSRFSVAT